MNRSTLTYLVMLAVFGVGIVWILKTGARLKAAPSLEGTWRLSWSGAIQGDNETAPPAHRMRIDQSGRYLQIAFDTGLRLNARMTEVAADHEARDAPSAARVVLEADPWKLTAEGALGGNEFRFVLAGPERLEFVGIREAEAERP